MEPGRINIREACMGDLGSIISLYRDLHEDPVIQKKDTPKSIFEEILADKRLHLFILEADGAAAATCILDIVPNLSWGAKPYGLIENVVTKKQLRRMGYGTMLLEHALGFAWGKDCYKVMLLTGRKEEYVMDFYENAGFFKDIKKGLIAINPEYSENYNKFY